MNNIPFFARIFNGGFQIGGITIDILDVIPSDTPIEIVQGIYFDHLGNEVIF
jgi:hypothetical protein